MSTTSKKSEDGSEELENNNIEVKMEIDNPDEVKTENGGYTSPVPSASTEQNESIADVEKAESDSGKSCNGGPAIHLTAPTLSKRNVTLQMLLAAGILKPGEGTMSLEYHGQKFVGDLLENGQIKSQETSQIFSSPSAWAVACKQIINPEKIQRKSGCGWASIKYRSLKLDYYKTVWFKRVREGSIDIRNISNGTTSSSEDSDDEGTPHCVVKFGEHFDSCPSYQTAVMSGAQVLIECSDFKDMDRLQPFHVKMAVEAVALADFHCNITNTETVGYLSGHWNSDQNQLSVDAAHPCKVLMPHSNSVDCDTERNRIALEIQRMGHDVIGWYHSHPKAPAEPSKDDINRQLDYQIMMKGASESAYVPCVGLIISPMCYSNQDMKTSKLKLFWVLPPPENRPLELGRPMRLEHEIIHANDVDTKKLMISMEAILNYYKENKSMVDLNDLTSGRFEKLKDTVSSWVPELKGNKEFWNEVKHLFTSPVPPRVNNPPVSLPKPEVKLEQTKVESISVTIKEERPESPSSSKAAKVSPVELPLDDPTAVTSSLPLAGTESSNSNSSRSASTPSSNNGDPVAP